VITYSNKKCVVVSTLQSFTSASSAHLVKYFFEAIIYLSPEIFDGGLIGPTKSISHFPKTYKFTVLNSCGAIPLLKYSIISTKYSLAVWNENSYALENFSSKLVGYSPFVTLDR
jgi:hypothetical protein